MVSYNKLKLLILFLGVIQIAPSQGSWFNWCSTIVGITCRTTIPALGGACIPASSWLCGRRRRRALSDVSTSKTDVRTFETNTVIRVPRKDTDQHGQPLGLIKVFTVRIKKNLIHSYTWNANRRLIRLRGCTD